jgi:hypothetical protein
LKRDPVAEGSGSGASQHRSCTIRISFLVLAIHTGWPSNNRLQRTALRAAAEPGRSASTSRPSAVLWGDLSGTYSFLEERMARPMTAAEKQRFRGYFPSLNVDQAVVTGETSTVYNCISWTVGVTDRWLWPGSSIGDFDNLYRGFGFVRAGDGPIAAWGHSTSNMTHGSISGPGHGPRWESKCGSDLRIQHGLNELVGSSYGRVVAFYRRSRLLEAVFASIVEKPMKDKASRTCLTGAEKKALRDQVNDVPTEARAAFEASFNAWKNTWFSGGLAISSNPHTRAVGKEFDALIALGPAILPLLVEKLADPENFLALQLYDAMQPNERLVVQFAAEDERILEGEQGRARRVVQAWFANQ